MFLCYCLPEKDSKSRTKTNSSPALIRAYGRTDGRTDVTSKFSRLDGLPISIAMVLRPRAPSAPAGAPLLFKMSKIAKKAKSMLFDNNPLFDCKKRKLFYNLRFLYVHIFLTKLCHEILQSKVIICWVRTPKKLYKTTSEERKLKLAKLKTVYKCTNDELENSRLDFGTCACIRDQRPLS